MVNSRRLGNVDRSRVWGASQLPGLPGPQWSSSCLSSACDRLLSSCSIRWSHYQSLRLIVLILAYLPFVNLYFCKFQQPLTVCPRYHLLVPRFHHEPCFLSKQRSRYGQGYTWPWARLVVYITSGVSEMSPRRKRRALPRGARMNLESRGSLRRKLKPLWKIPLSLHPLSRRVMRPLREKNLKRKKVETGLGPR